MIRLAAAGVWIAGGCFPIEPDDGVTGPEPPTDLAVTASTTTPEVFEGGMAVLRAATTGGSPPYLFRWDQNGGPADIEPTNLTTDILSVGTFIEPGRYVFRVVATDAIGAHTSDFVAIEVLPAVTADAPALVVVGEAVGLTAIVDLRVGEVTLLWEIVSGSGSLDAPGSAAPTLTTTEPGTVEVRLTVSYPGGVETTRSFEIISVEDRKPRVLLETNFGDFTIELDGERAPLHTANFLLYVDDGFFDGLLFHRNACKENVETDECEPFVLQGGGYRRVDGELERVEAVRDPVPSEADNGLSNGTKYSVALTLRGGDVNSGTTEFYVNLQDNSFLDDLGFTVFGMVVEGTDIVDAIVAGETTDSSVIPGEVSLPVEDVIMEQVTRLSMVD